jgi:hypothetical protein
MLLNEKLGNLLVIHGFAESLIRQPSVHVAYGNGNDFFGSGKAAQDLAHTILAQRPHSQFPCALPQHQSGVAFVDHMAHLIVDHKNFKYAHSTLVTDLTALLASHRFHHLRFMELARLNLQCAQFRLGKFPRLFAVIAQTPDKPLGQDRADRGRNKKRLNTDID